MFNNIRMDIKRLNEPFPSWRNLFRGVASQGFHALVVYRFFHWLRKKKIPAQPVRFIIERMIEIGTGISIPAECRLGKGLRIHHFGGVIMHPTVKMGENCTIYHGVTIGDRGGSGGAATIGNNVIIGAGAKIIGEISIGDNCKIGANVVIDRDLPPNSIARSPACEISSRA